MIEYKNKTCSPVDAAASQPLYLLHLSLHGLVRYKDPELGCDVDTGGQIKYVLELIHALSQSTAVGKIDLFTRLIQDPALSEAYRVPLEVINKKTTIVRLPCGPDEYLKKENLWPYLEEYTDAVLTYLRKQPRLPDAIHAHYADAAFVGLRLSQRLGVPLVFTAHSLGRVKRRRLLEEGEAPAQLEQRFVFGQRIDTEERALAYARLIIANSEDEKYQQYGMYDGYAPSRIQVIPPGFNHLPFSVSLTREKRVAVTNLLVPFLKELNKPLILMLARPNKAKNAATLLEAFGKHPTLRNTANLALFLGQRDDLQELGTESQAVLNEVFALIDRYNLYGHVAYPKQHQGLAEAVYRFTAETRGIFCNPALYESFGLTILEAAASGLPVVVTQNGGAKDIVANLENGVTVDPQDPTAMGNALCALLENKAQWQQYQSNGKARVADISSWKKHVSLGSRLGVKFFC